ncbi:SDR family oxidoreductase [Neisseriaceae bacterium TC5R-5]|nr:SDR family oxidoreductase [Neisseriaceae bacterium TC5R-5]
MSHTHPQRIALVTGASSGFGRAICERMVKDGYRVIAAARRMDRLVQLHDQLGPQLLPWELDVCDAVAVQALLADLPAEFRHIDVLVNNAGLALGLEPAHQAHLEDWETMIATNISGLTRITRALLPGMVERRRGHIINMGSIAGTYPYPGGNVYGATKAFVAQFSLNLRADLAGTGIRVSDVQPGLCGGTEFSAVRFHGDEQKAQAVYRDVQPLTALDVAEAVSWIANLPAHVNINSIEMMPVAQSFSALQITRENQS